jgi:phosphoinositide-3-kinase, regulatory subunit 4
LASETAPLLKSIFYEGLEHAQNIGDILLKSSGKKEQIVHGGRYPGTTQSGSLANLKDILRPKGPNIASSMSLYV